MAQLHPQPWELCVALPLGKASWNNAGQSHEKLCPREEATEE